MRDDSWGPHENPYAEDYDWWVHENDAYVRGHRLSVECGVCGGEMYYSELVDGMEFLYLCPNCSEEYETRDGRTLSRPLSLGFMPNGSPREWSVWVRHGREAEVELAGGRLRATIDAEDDRDTFYIHSPTLFDAEELSTDGGLRTIPTTQAGYPAFRGIEKPAEDDFDITIRDCGCGRDWCDGIAWSAGIGIEGERWSVRAGTHYPYVMVHREGTQIRKYHPVNLDGPARDALRRSFWRELENLGYEGAWNYDR